MASGKRGMKRRKWDHVEEMTPALRWGHTAVFGSHWGSVSNEGLQSAP